MYSDGNSISTYEENVIHFNEHQNKITKDSIKKIVGMEVNNISLYKNALMHKSLYKITETSNERLEFLGDSVVNLIVAEYLYKKYPDENEGFLTKLRTKLVNRFTLCKLSKFINLHECVLLSKRIDTEEGRNNTKILEDVFESFVGAMFLDLGLNKCKIFLIDVLERFINFEDILVDDNFKDILLRYTQKYNMSLPEYMLILQSGPPHKRLFTVQVEVNGQKLGVGYGSSKKVAEQHSAKLTLEMYGVDLSSNINDQL